jgi:hypothetical protein
MEQTEKYLLPTQGIDSDNVVIKQKAEDLIDGQGTNAEKAKTLFYWVRDQIKYTPIVPDEVFDGYRASDTLRRKKGFCVEKASLLAAFARAVGIPARIHLADIRNHLISERLMEVMQTNLFACHGYCEMFLGGDWIKATPAFDLVMCQENRIKPVEFDGKQDAIFHSHNVDGELHIEYVKDRGYYDHVPLDYMITTFEEIYGSEMVGRVNQFIQNATDK